MKKLQQHIIYLLAIAVFSTIHIGAMAGSNDLYQIIIKVPAPAQAFVGDTFTVAAETNTGPSVRITIDAIDNGCSITSGGFGQASILLTSGTTPCKIIYENKGYPTRYNVTVAIRLFQHIDVNHKPPLTAAKDDVFTVKSSATSGLAVTLTSNEGCVVKSDISVLMGESNCIITLNQAGDDNYYPADPIQFFILFNTWDVPVSTLPTAWLCIEPDQAFSAKVRVSGGRNEGHRRTNTFYLEADVEQETCFDIGTINVNPVFSVTIAFDEYLPFAEKRHNNDDDDDDDDNDEIELLERTLSGKGYLDITGKTITKNTAIIRTRGNTPRRVHNEGDGFDYEIIQQENTKSILAIRVKGRDVE